MARLMHLDPTSPELNEVRCWTKYGIDEEAPFPEINTPNNVEIPQSQRALCNPHLQELMANVSPFLNDGNEGIDVYKGALEEIENAMENPCCNITNLL